MSEPTPALDFSIFNVDPGTDVLAETPAAEAAAEDAVTPVAEPEAQAESVEEAPSPEGTTPKNPLALTDDDMVVIKQDGKDVPVRWGDYKGNIMRVADYTRKTTRVAEREKEVETVAQALAQRESQLLELVRDPRRLAALYERQFGQRLAPAPAAQPQAAAQTDDEIATAGDLRKTEEQVLAKARETFEQMLAQVEEQKQQLQSQEFVTTLRTATETVVDAVLQEHGAMIGHIPHVDSIIKKMAWADYQPKTIEDTKKAIVESAKKLAGMVAAGNREQKKQDAIKQTRLKKGIEPAGGAAPAQQKKSYTKADGKADWDELDRDVVSWINGGGGRNRLA
jgi:hypothetical protein